MFDPNENHSVYDIPPPTPPFTCTSDSYEVHTMAEDSKNSTRHTRQPHYVRTQTYKADTGVLNIGIRIYCPTCCPVCHSPKPAIV